MGLPLEAHTHTHEETSRAKNMRQCKHVCVLSYPLDVRFESWLPCHFVNYSSAFHLFLLQHSDEDELFSDDDSDSDTSDEEEDGGDPKDAAANDTAAARSGSRPNTSGSSSSGAFGFRPNIVPMKTPREEASSLPSSWNDAVGAESKEEEEDLDEETGQLLREAQNLMKEDDDEEEDKKGGAKKGKGGDVENIDFKIGSDSQGERPGSGAWFYGKEPDEESTPLLQLWPPLGVVAEALTGAATTSTNHAWVGV